MHNFFRGLRAQLPSPLDNHWRDSITGEEFEIDDYPVDGTSSLYIVRVIWSPTESFLGYTFTDSLWDNNVPVTAPERAFDYSICFVRKEVQADGNFRLYHYFGSVTFYDPAELPNTIVTGRKFISSADGAPIVAAGLVADGDWIPTRPPAA